MEVEEIKEKKIWNEFLEKHGGGFLQSWQWGKFKSRNQKMHRLGCFSGEAFEGVCQIFEERLPLGKYLYIPYGPVVSKNISSDEFLKEIKNYMRKRADFIRVEPIEKIRLGREAFNRHQPKKTLIIDLKTEDELLEGFDKDTRYSVRRANREGVNFREAEAVDSFYNLLSQASGRHGFGIYSEKYYQDLFDLEITRLFEVRHDGDVLASAFVVFFGDQATYLHAGSSEIKREFCGSTLLNFEIMNKAFKAGFSRYDFWGIDEEKMPGVTKFKKGFGGEEVRYPEARDISFNLKYGMYKKAHQIKSNFS